MKDQIRTHVDRLFVGIHETKQLQELKEEISTNLLDRVNDSVARGVAPELAFHTAVEELGDMTELVDSLKAASETKWAHGYPSRPFIDRSHVLGYITASVVVLLGLLVGGYSYLQETSIATAVLYFVPFLLVAVPVFMYFGLTQETRHDYGMSSRRSLAYSLATEILILGLAASALEFYQGHPWSMLILTLGPFVIVSAVIFIYLGLTEKSRRKMGSQWQEEWVSYYSDPHTAMVRGSISGALWILSIAAFFIIGFVGSWAYSWIVFVIAVGCEPLIEAYFAARRKR